MAKTGNGLFTEVIRRKKRNGVVYETEIISLLDGFTSLDNIVYPPLSLDEYKYLSNEEARYRATRRLEAYLGGEFINSVVVYGACVDISGIVLGCTEFGKDYYLVFGDNIVINVER